MSPSGARVVALLVAIGCAGAACAGGYALVPPVAALLATRLAVASPYELVVLRVETGAVLALPFVYGWALAWLRARRTGHAVGTGATVASGLGLAVVAVVAGSARLAMLRAMLRDASAIAPMLGTDALDFWRWAFFGSTGVALLALAAVLSQRVPTR